MGSVCGIDKAEINKAGSDKIAKEDCARADRFNDTLEKMREEGGDAAYESSVRAAGATGKDHKCAAANNEVAAVDTLRARRQPGVDRCSAAQSHYENAGADRAYASVDSAMAGDDKLAAAKRAKTHKEAAKNYGEAAKHYEDAARHSKKSHDDLRRAEEIATWRGRNDDAAINRDRADKAKEAWKEENKAAKAAAEKAEAHIKQK